MRISRRRRPPASPSLADADQHAREMTGLKAKDEQINTLLATAEELVGDLRATVAAASHTLRGNPGGEN
jgi:hypothetical protein